MAKVICPEIITRVGENESLKGLFERKKFPKRTCIDTPSTDGCKVIYAADVHIKALISPIHSFNEEFQLSNRYVKFNLEELVKTPVNTCDGAKSCTVLSLAKLQDTSLTL